MEELIFRNKELSFPLINTLILKSNFKEKSQMQFLVFMQSISQHLSQNYNTCIVTLLHNDTCYEIIVPEWVSFYLLKQEKTLKNLARPVCNTKVVKWWLRWLMLGPHFFVRKARPKMSIRVKNLWALMGISTRLKGGAVQLSQIHWNQCVL